MLSLFSSLMSVYFNFIFIRASFTITNQMSRQPASIYSRWYFGNKCTFCFVYGLDDFYIALGHVNHIRNYHYYYYYSCFIRFECINSTELNPRHNYVIASDFTVDDYYIDSKHTAVMSDTKSYSLVSLQIPSGSSRSWLTIGEDCRPRLMTAPNVCVSSTHTADSWSGPTRLNHTAISMSAILHVF